MSKDWYDVGIPWMSGAQQVDSDGDDVFYWDCRLCDTDGMTFSSWNRDARIARHVESAEHRDRLARCNTWCGPTPNPFSEDVWGFCFLPPGHGDQHRREIFPWENRAELRA